MDIFNSIENFFTSEECNTVLDEITSNSNRIIDAFGNVKLLGKSWFRVWAPSFAVDKLELLKLYKKYFEIPAYFGPGQQLLLTKLQALYPQYEFTYCKKLGPAAYKIIEFAQPEFFHTDGEKTSFYYKLEFADFANFDDYFDDHKIITLMLSKGHFTFDYFPKPYNDWDFGQNPIWNRNTAFESFVMPKDSYKTINYKQGHLIVQNKNFVHRAGASRFTSGPRITLQGNIAIKKDKAFIYW